jgi:hypothetical protein
LCLEDGGADWASVGEHDGYTNIVPFQKKFLDGGRSNFSNVLEYH